MAVAVRVLAGTYHDSVKLMRIAAEASGAPGVRLAIAVLGSPMNREQLAGAGLLAGEAKGAGPNDLVLAVEAADEETAAGALAGMEEALRAAPATSGGGGPGDLPAPTLEAALGGDPGINLALLSIPGEHVRREAERALRKGLHCLIFSDNVPLADEVALKEMARARGLLLMGPDCGTAHIGGVGLGFCNVMRAGPIGLAGASGTGLQEAMAAIDAAGGGIRCALGTGGRDISDAVGGMAMVDAIKTLAADGGTEALLVLGKPPGPRAMEAVLGALARSGKPAVVHFVGAPVEALERSLPEGGGITAAATLAEAGVRAACLAEGREPPPPPDAPGDLLAAVSAWGRRRGPGRGFLRGLYTGGTLCAEAQALLGPEFGPIRSNAPLEKKNALADPEVSEGHTAVDLGEDFFTRGRPHPMIDPAPRGARILQEAKDPEAAVVLLDVVLGLGVHPDPAGEAARAVREALAARPDLLFVAAVTGTGGDPQGLEGQRGALREAGALVAPTHAQACLLAGAALRECAS